MSYKVSEQEVADYYHRGFIVFRQVLPTSLIADLRRACAAAGSLAREAGDVNVQRLQPIGDYAGRIDLKPFRDYAELPALREALDHLELPVYRYGQFDVLGVLLNPVEQPWCTTWHRDITLESSRLPSNQYEAMMLDWQGAMQINCPLYADDCTWFVPGSHLRARDFPGELAASRRHSTEALSARAAVEAAAQERLCRDYAASMPGAAQLHLQPGDFCLYRPLGWHIGNYVPYRRRATLHDILFTPRFEAWWRQWIAGGSPAWPPAP